jgi:hypothetical protein
MAVGRVVKHQNLRHYLLLNGCVTGGSRVVRRAVDLTSSKSSMAVILRMGDILDGSPVARIRKHGLDI